jgi:hypothetical protein
MWHDFLIVNKWERVWPEKAGNDKKIRNTLILLFHFYARSVGNLIKNSVILEVGTSANSFIHIPVHIVVDVAAGRLCRPRYT